MSECKITLAACKSNFKTPVFYLTSSFCTFFAHTFDILFQPGNRALKQALLRPGSFNSESISVTHCCYVILPSGSGPS